MNLQFNVQNDFLYISENNNPIIYNQNNIIYIVIVRHILFSNFIYLI